MTDRLHPDDLSEGMAVEIAWSPKGDRGAGREAEGEVTGVWRPDDEVEQFTVEAGDRLLNVYTDYRDPPVERVEDPHSEEPDAETVGRLDGLARVE